LSIEPAMPSQPWCRGSKIRVQAAQRLGHVRQNDNICYPSNHVFSVASPVVNICAYEHVNLFDYVYRHYSYLKYMYRALNQLAPIAPDTLTRDRIPRTHSCRCRATRTATRRDGAHMAKNEDDDEDRTARSLSDGGEESRAANTQSTNRIIGGGRGIAQRIRRGICYHGRHHEHLVNHQRHPDTRGTKATLSSKARAHAKRASRGAIPQPTAAAAGVAALRN